MAKVCVFGIFDVKGNYYVSPMFGPTNESAVRSFQDAVRNKQSILCDHPEDYVLFRLGTWDPNTGKFENELAPISLAVGSQFANLSHSNVDSII